jgi:MFS family permease
MLPVGAASTAFIATSNSLLQLNATPEMRGRVMALFTMVFLGSTPLGGPLIGWISQVAGPREGLGVGAIAAIVAGAIGMIGLRSTGRGRVAEDAGGPVTEPEAVGALTGAS